VQQHRKHRVHARGDLRMAHLFCILSIIKASCRKARQILRRRCCRLLAIAARDRQRSSVVLAALLLAGIKGSNGLTVRRWGEELRGSARGRATHHLTSPSTRPDDAAVARLPPEKSKGRGLVIRRNHSDSRALSSASTPRRLQHWSPERKHFGALRGITTAFLSPS
jgi:hypothetical protein